MVERAFFVNISVHKIVRGGSKIAKPKRRPIKKRKRLPPIFQRAVALPANVSNTQQQHTRVFTKKHEMAFE